MAKNIALINSVNLSFELKCLDLLTKAYVSSIAEKSIAKDWEEESISAHLVKHLRNIKNDFIINYEVPLLEEDVVNAKKRVKNSNRIDIFFQHNQWGKKLYLEYHAEAKNISLSNWKKSSGNLVNASQQQTEYITKGIDRFLIGHFKDKKGCMLGYIVNGDLNDLLLKINSKIESLKSKADEITFDGQKVNTHKIYNSTHLQRKLTHLFFDYAI